ncbi:hypothetical protein Leryth_020544 [Lithospermum erythrorhizon]|nr:hypothetical protein Leryth_020544 [Lithospermum erythrorhizon]
MGIDPITHKKTHNLSSSNEGMMNLSVIHHIAQWESTRLEAEARLAQHPKNLSAPHNKNSNENVANEDSFMMKPSFDILKAWQSGYGNTNNGAAQPYTLSFLESAVSMLAMRESFKTTATWSTGHAYDNVKNVDNIWSSQNDIVLQEDNKVLISEDGIGDVLLPGNVRELNIGEENYWGDFSFSNNNNPETLYSVVF